MLPRRRAAIRTHSSASASSLSAAIRPSATWQTVIRSRNLGRNLYGLEYSRSVLGAYVLIREQDGHVHSILVARGRDSARCARRAAACWCCAVGSQRQIRARRGSSRTPGDALAERYQDPLPETPALP